MEEAGGTQDGAGTSSGGAGADAAIEAMAPVPVGDGGSDTCLGTLYSAGFKCGPMVAAGMPCTTLTGAAAPTVCMNNAAGLYEPKCMMCPPDGEECCPSPPSQEPGWSVGQLLRGSADSVTFTNVYAPADGDYDIVWYYHCANADTNGYASPTCPAATQGSMTGNGGCRGAAFTVNGVDDPKTYEVPCFLRISAMDHGWHHVHTWVRTQNVKSTVRVPFHLKAGSSNTIKLYARGTDTIDVSAIRVPDGRQGPF
jgi:hypothetical protein